MRNRYLVILLTLLVSTSGIFAQEQKKENFFVQTFNLADRIILFFMKPNVDTSYVRVPERDFMVTLKNRETFQNYELDFPVLVSDYDLPAYIRPILPSNYKDFLYTRTHIQTAKASMQIGFDWHGFVVNLPIPISNSFSRQYSLSSTGARFGGKISYTAIDEPKGTIDNGFAQLKSTISKRYWNRDETGTAIPNNDPMTPQATEADPNNWSLRTLFMEAYYVFNYKKFNLPAGRTGRMLQRKSAGSMYLMMNYTRSNLWLRNALEADEDNFINDQVSIGAGYGYNWAFADGKACIQVSAIPMFGLLNRETHKFYDDPNNPWDQYLDEALNALAPGSSYHNHFYDAVKYGRDSGFTVSAISRIGANYNIGRYLLNLSVEYRQYLFNSCTDVSVKNRSVDLTLKLGYRLF